MAASQAATRTSRQVDVSACGPLLEILERVISEAEKVLLNNALRIQAGMVAREGGSALRELRALLAGE